MCRRSVPSSLARGPLRLCVVALVSLLLPALPGCGGGGGGGGSTGPVTPATCGGLLGTPYTLLGKVRYERLILTPSGVGPATQWRPARYVDVEVRDPASGTCYGRTSTDVAGNYALTIAPPDGGAIYVEALARTVADPLRDYAVHDAALPQTPSHDPNNVWRAGVNTTAGTVAQTVDLDIPYNGRAARPGAGFGLLDTMMTCLDQVAEALGHSVGDVHAYMSLGNNFGLGGVSFYRTGINALAILGGAAGNLDNSDTDYFDDAVVAHEIGHFVESRWSHSMSRGGSHGGERIEPAFAFSEGQATGFGNLLLRDPLYVDSRSTSGALIFSLSTENVTGAADSDGIGGEFTIAEIIWDLGDGVGGIPDSDGDGVAAPLSELYAALATFQPATTAPYIGAMMDAVVAQPSVSAGQMAGLMTSPENQGISYPLAGADIWPLDIGIGGTDSGTLDSLRGAGKNQCQGLTSSAWYRLTLASARSVTLNLAITPLAGSGNNLNLFLHTNEDVFTSLAGSSNPGGAAESVSANLGPGTYIIRVVADCLGDGNRASYVLSVN